MFWVGTNGMNRRVADYAPNLVGANTWISISAFVLGAGFLLFIGNMLWGATKGPKVGSNPWSATTLEWQISSPPPEHNFPRLPEIVGDPYPYGTKEPHAVIEIDEPAHAGVSGGE